MIEKSKLFKRMGAGLGLQTTKKSHRGYIAKKYLKKIELLEMAEFEKNLVDLTPRKRIIPVIIGGEVIDYI